jgi:hypothetical protein
LRFDYIANNFDIPEDLMEKCSVSIIQKINIHPDYERSREYFEKFENYGYKLLTNQFANLSDSDLKDNLIFLERLNTIQILKITKNRDFQISLEDNLIFRESIEPTKIFLNKFFNLLYIFSNSGNLTILSIQSQLKHTIPKLEEDPSSSELVGITSTKNYSKILAVFNKCYNSALRAEFRVFVEGKGLFKHSLSHIISVVHGCEISFEQSSIFVIGKMGNFSVLAAFQFNKDLMFICDYMRVDCEFNLLRELLVQICW